MGIFGDYANKYFEMGYNVLPVEGKNSPCISGHGEFGRNGVGPELIEQWVRQFPNANIAILPGGPSKIIAFDFDYNELNAKDLEEIILNLLPGSEFTKIGEKGWTKFYRVDEEMPTKPYKYSHPTKKKPVAWELLSTGRYTVIPPSIHPITKEPYRWVMDSLSNIAPGDLPVLKKHILEEIVKQTDLFFKNPEKATGRNNRIWAYAIKSALDFKTESEWINNLIEYDLKKHPSNPWFRDKSEMSNRSYESNIIYYTKSWLKSIKSSMKRYYGIDFSFGAGAEFPEFFYSKDIEKIENLYEGVRNKFLITEVVELNGKEKEKKVWQYKNLPSMLIDVEGVSVYNNNYIYWHNEKYYEHLGDKQFQKIIQSRIDESASSRTVKGFFDEAMISCQKTGRIPMPPSGFLNLKNGVFDVKNDKLISHSKKYFFRNCLEIEYNKDAKCPKWIEFLNDVFEENKDEIPNIQKMFGYTIVGGEPFLHKAFVLIGSGRNGKGVLLNILKEILGKGSYSGISLRNIDKPFSVVHLDGKLANITEEAPLNISAEDFKTLVGGGEANGAYKGKDEYLFKCNSRFIFACNDFPIFEDKNTSINDRLIFFEFMKTYVDGVNRDPFLFEKLKSELPGILNWAIDGAKMILKDQTIEQSESSLKTKEEFKSESNPVYAWFCENLKIEHNPAGISSNELYDNYRNWSELNGHRAMSYQKFTKRVSRIVKEKTGSSEPVKTIWFGANQLKGYDCILINRKFLDRERQIFNF